MKLKILPGELAVCRVPQQSAVPNWAFTGSLQAVVRTDDEISIVTAAAAVPLDVDAERGWRALKVRGPLEFSLTGVLASLAEPLAEAGVSIFSISTYETDYLLVKEEQLVMAVEALTQAAHDVS